MSEKKLRRISKLFFMHINVIRDGEEFLDTKFYIYIYIL